MRTKRLGSISMYGLLTMFVVLIATLGVSSFAISGLGRARREQQNVKYFELAQAGLEQAITSSYRDLDKNGGVFIPINYDFTAMLGPIANGATITAVVQPNADASYAWITATSNYNGYKKSVRALANEHNVGIWNNAIFAGSGASGHAVNGNVDVRGSVHILGDGEPFIDLNGNSVRDAGEPFTDTNGNKIYDPGEPYIDANGNGQYDAPEPYNDSNQNGMYDPPMTQTDMDSNFGGTAYIGNNYSGMPLQLEGSVPVPPRISGIETLNAEVRCKHGRIGISGTAHIGTLDPVDGGTSKGTVDGTYVTDGWAGTAGATQVFSDNGTASPYDIPDLGIEFPYIAGIGAQPYTAKDGSQWTTQNDYLMARSLLCPETQLYGTNGNGGAWSYGPDQYGNSISFKPGSPPMYVVNGLVRFATNIQIGKVSSTKDHVYYQGNGTLIAPNIYVDGDLLPYPGTIFPTTARLGLIAQSNMLLSAGAGSSQITMAGAFYAQGKIYSAKQNQIAGTFVSNFFDMGTNVPNIYQVPTLPYNMPPGMPGDKGFYSLRIRGWRERSPAQIR